MSDKAEQYKQAGNAAFAKHDLDLALANFTTAIQLDPSRAAYPLNRAAVYLKLRDWTRAEKDASTALRLDGGVNLKAWFRRAVARKNLGHWDLARQGESLPLLWFGQGEPAHVLPPPPADLEDAKRHGAGADVDAELAIVLQQLGLGAAAAEEEEPVRCRRNDKLDSKQASVAQASPPSQAPPPTPLSSTAPTSDRLRAALAKPASSSSATNSPSPSASAASSRPTTSSKATPARGDDLLSAVSTRRLVKDDPSSTKTTAPSKSAAASFAAKKEARLVREKETIAAARRENRDDDASSMTGLTTTTVAPVTVSELTTPPPAPPVPSTSSRTSAQAPITTLSAPQSPTIGINSPTALEAHFLALNARQIPRGDPERYGPLKRLALELELHRNKGSGSGSGSWREWMGQAGLTPDLLSEMMGEVVALVPPAPAPDPDADAVGDRDHQHLEWVFPLLEGLTTCHRWDSASLFLSEEEREAVKRVLERARRRLEGVAGRWGV